MKGTCRFCGREGEGVPFEEWVKPTFTDWDKLVPGGIVCNDCLFWFQEKSEGLARRMGKEKPQKMRTYSHFIVNGEWTPLSKAQKEEMFRLLTSTPFPELAVVSRSGQKHLVFRAPRNAAGSRSGWVQFEEQTIFVRPEDLREMVCHLSRMVEVFSKGEIESGKYAQNRIRRYGLGEFLRDEGVVKAWRGRPLFSLALFLVQKGGEYGCG